MYKKIGFILAFAFFTSATSAAQLTILQQADVSILTQNNGNTFKEIAHHKDERNGQHIRYQQYFNHVPVFGYQLIKHEFPSKPSFVTGTLVQNIPVTAATLTSQAAIALAQKSAGVTEQTAQAQLVYYIDHNQAKLAYVVDFAHQQSHPFYIIDAAKPVILNHWEATKTLASNQSLSTLHTQATALKVTAPAENTNTATGPGGNSKIGRYEYGSDALHGYLPVLITRADKCIMLTPFVETINGEDQKPFEFPCPHHEGDAVNGGYSPLNDAHYYGDKVMHMYDKWYGISPVDNMLTIQTHLTNLDNAFYRLGSIYLGDGENAFYPLTDIDAVSYVIALGFLDKHFGSVVSRQFDAIEYAFCSMASKAAQFYWSGKNDWQVGSAFTKGTPALYYMDNPKQDGFSIDDARYYSDSLDPHYSAGVYTKMFYVLATKNGWNTHKAFDVMMNAALNYWMQTTDFETGAHNVVQAAADLGDNVQDVIDAFDVVGIACDHTHCAIKS